MSNTQSPSIPERLFKIKAAIRAAQTSEHQNNAVKLLAVSKTCPVTAVQAAFEAGQIDFGENYATEGVDKIATFNAQLPENNAIWHFIGPIQSNKTRPIAAHFDWVHTVERAKIADRLNEQRPANMSPLNVLIQVNISSETNKSGCTADEALDLALHIITLPHLKLRGLMCIPAAIDADIDLSLQRAPFEATAALHAMIKKNLPVINQDDFDTLSMGMSGDFTIAIAAGATIVRVGSAIFGERTVK